MKKSFIIARCLFLLMAVSVAGLGGCYSDDNNNVNKEIVLYSFTTETNAGLTEDSAGVIAGTDIVVVVPQGTAVNALVATYTTSGTKVKVGSTVQTSGVTPNNFTSPVTYAVYGSNNTMKNYSVKVAFEANGGSYGIVWQGSLPAAPANPEINWAYYNTTNGTSYIWDGDSWEVLCRDGTDGTNGTDGIDGISIVWLGSLTDYPDSPLVNYAFYHTGDGISYIWDGDSWEILCQDGESGSTGSLNVTGTVASGSYLFLVHDLSQDDLTFTGQFLKNDNIYNYTDYADYFGAGITELGECKEFTDQSTTSISTTTLTNGNVFIAYPYSGNSGTFVIYDTSRNRVAGPTIFDSAVTAQISTKTLTNGNIFITYRNYSNSGYGTFVIYDSSGSLVVGPTVFESASTDDISVTTLHNGNVFIAYRDDGNSSYGTFVIYDSSGSLVAGPTVFESAMTLEISTTTLPNGNVFIAYHDGGNSGYGTFVIYDSSGSLVVDPTVFEYESTSYISTTLLASGNVFIAYRGGGFGYGTFVIYSSTGSLVAGPGVFENRSTAYISTTLLINGSILIAYDDDGNGTFTILAEKSLKLQKISPNVVRLWNFTGETLDMTLSIGW